MSKYLYKVAVEHPIFKVIADASEALKLESYVIGGYVRDFILDKEKLLRSVRIETK